ncbi:TatD family hydrolase [Methanobacterium alcaliphilum]|uniref:TatD family hydrolase n=1 Tax=Methanobacterium alcaliphilum TaxID=392018 RepID=UPI002009FEB5|nr:TatD family hydrolase [Methanobacterium alcaliphilum]MCK9151721.1 TatD family hydrolase [Methanobacterium alcaliphilum]
MDIPITDNHIHVDPYNGEGPLKIAQTFHRSGGKRMIIPNKPSWTFGEPFNFQKAMHLVLDYVKKINTESEVEAYAVVGLHPAELSRLLESGKNINTARDMVKKGLDYAQKLVLEGEAVAIGEIGRPHYEVSPEEWDLQNEIMIYTMKLARDAGCPVQLHTETSQEPQFKEFALMADKAGLKRYKLIKHFSGPYTDEIENHGLTPSLIATRDVVSKGIKKSNYFLMETDYLDDASRPGAVLGPKTVPRRTLEFIKKGLISEDDAYKIHSENIKKVYGIE